jgi:hypothetical protein
MEYKYILNKVLTQKAKKIFGEIVKEAYIGLSDISEIEDRDVLILTVESNCYTVSDIEIRCRRCKDSFEIQGDTIVLRFTNNQLVEFQVSEWLKISSIEF